MKQVPISVLLLCALQASCPALEVDAFPFFKTLRARDEAARTIGMFDIDEELFKRTDKAFADMRVVDADGREAPFLVRPARDRRMVVTEHDIPLETRDFELLPDNRFRVVLARKSEKTPPDASVLVLRSSQKNYEKKVSVWSSTDRETWRELAADAPIYDYSRYLTLSRDRVPLAPDRQRYYRVDVSNITQEELSPLIRLAREERDGRLYSRIEKSNLQSTDFRVDSFQLLERRETWSEKGARLRAYTVEGLNVTEDPARQTTVVEFRTANIPLRELQVEVGNTYFSRHVTLDGSSDDEGNNWQRVTDGTIQRVPGHDAANARRITTASPCRYHRYRLTIHNQDSPPLEVESVTVRGEVRQVVFLCEPDNEYRVVYGASALAVPRYDVSRIVSGARPNEMDVYEPGPESVYAGHRNPRMGWLRSGRTLLIPAVVLMVGILVWLIVKAAKQVETPPVE